MRGRWFPNEVDCEVPHRLVRGSIPYKDVETSPWYMYFKTLREAQKGKLKEDNILSTWALTNGTRARHWAVCQRGPWSSKRGGL